MSFSGLTLRDLEYIVSVADHRAFGRAAARCGVSQPALSSQVRKVETLFGFDIFERSTRRVLLTAHGDQFVKQARRVLEEASVLSNLGRASPHPFGGELRLAAISTLGPYLFPRVVEPLRKAYPDTDLLLSEGLTREITESLLNGTVDAILISLPLQGQGLTCSEILVEPFVLACPKDHPAAAPDGPGWDELAMNDRLVLGEGHCLREQALAACAFVDASRRLSMSIETVKYMVAAREGCTLLPALSIGRSDPIVYRAMKGSLYSRRIALAWRQSDPRQAQFQDLAETLRKITVSEPCLKRP